MSIAWQLSNGIEIATANSAAEFIEALRPSNPHWWENGTCPWVFRGHAYENWSLLPSAWRPDNRIIENCKVEAARRFDVAMPAQVLNWLFPPSFLSSAASFSFCDDDLKLARLLSIATTAEYLPIWDFASICNDLGMQVPLSAPGPDPIQDPNWLANATNPLVGDELLRFSDLPATLALAQHHGIPTRLLDWTQNPMAAAFFAVEPLQSQIGEANLIVWALHKRHAKEVSVDGVLFPGSPSGAPRLDPTISIVRPSTRDNPFLAAQAGLFTTISYSGIYFMKSSGQRPSLDAFVVEAKPAKNVLRKIKLSHKCAADLIEILHRERISRSALMPTMDNAAKDVLTKWHPHKS